MEKYKDISNQKIKQFKDETSTLKNAISMANKEVKNLKREVAHLEHENKKKCEAYEFQIDRLKGLYSEKMANEKDVKTREKKLKKKARELEEEKCQEKVTKENSNTSTNSKMVDDAALPTQVQSELNIECLEAHSMKTTNMDPIT
jgi:predicted RNase H-like nuclease (RuvC/YqgF family)